MPVHETTDVKVTPELLEAITTFPVRREVHHCGTTFTAPSLDLYSTCPTCGARLKLRSFSGVPELEDVFDAVLAWMHQPGAETVARQRVAEIAADSD
jgi:hypothetical protein